MTQAFTTQADRLTVMIPPCGVPENRMRGVVDSLIGPALRLAGTIHGVDDLTEAGEVINKLTLDQLLVLPFVLAAMVDIDKTPGEMLGWTGYVPPAKFRRVTAVAPASVLTGPPARRPGAVCGTRKGFISHQQHGEPPCRECTVASDAWERTRRATHAAA